MSLEQAYATQLENEGVKSPWYIKQGDDVIFELPKQVTAQEAMGIIKFGREYESIAFQEGLKFAKQQADKKMLDLEAKYIGVIQQLEFENEKLARALDKNLNKEG